MSAPTITGASFTNAANSSISLKFSEPVTLVNASGLGLTRMTAEGDGWWQSTWIGIWGVNGSGTSTLTIATHDLLRPASVARVQYEFSRGGIADLDGNKLLGQEVWIGGSGTSIIDLSDYYPNLPLTAVTVYGNGGADVLTGTRGRDTLVGGADADTLVGDGGADRIDLVEKGRSIPYARDIVKVESGHSSRAAIDRVVGFDVSSTSIAKHDVLDLPSRVIAANISNANGTDAGALARHSISSGIVTFKNAANVVQPINESRLSDALKYLSLNLKTAGATLGFAVDSNSNGRADALYVYQDNGTVSLDGNFVLPDTVIRLDGVQGATLGTTAGARVVQLQDTQPPDGVGRALTTHGFAVNCTESVFATTQLALSIQKNGSGKVFEHPSSVHGNGSSSLTLDYAGLSLAAADWAMVRYAGNSRSNGVRDGAGNVFRGDEDYFAEGGSGANTIDLHGRTAGYYVDGNAGNDTIVGSRGEDAIEGGRGADRMSGHSGADNFIFDQGDSPRVSFAERGGTGVSTGDTFTFAGGRDDLTSDFGSGDEIEFEVRFDDYTGVRDPGKMARTPSNGRASEQGFFLVQGDFSGGVFTVNRNGGDDTLVVYDGDPGTAVTQTGIVLTGVTLAQIDAFTGDSYIAYG